MKPVNRKTENSAIDQQLAKIQLSEQDLQCARFAARDGEAIADGLIRAKEAITGLGALLLKPAFRR